MDQPITETIGVDLGDKFSTYCVLDQVTGEVYEPDHDRSRAQAA